MFNLLHSRYESLFCIPDEKRSGNRLHLEVREDAERRPVLQGHTNMGRRRSRGASAPDTELVGSSSFGEDMATENDIPGGRSEVQGRQLHQDEDDMQGYTAARGGGRRGDGANDDDDELSRSVEELSRLVPRCVVDRIVEAYGTDA